MSRNDQLLVKEYKDKFYVFDVMAESWCDYDEDDNILETSHNYLRLSEAKGSFYTREEAHEFARKYDQEDEYLGSEYGVVDEVLRKDGASVTIIDDTMLHEMICELIIAIDENIEYGDSWDQMPENKDVFKKCESIINKYKEKLNG